MLFRLAVAALLLMPSSGFAAQARSLPPGAIRPKSAPLVFTRETAVFMTPGGMTLRANLMVPANPWEERFPAIMVFGGFEEAGRILDLVNPPAPVLVASFDYPFEAPRKFEFPGSFKHAPAAKRAVADTVGGILALHQLLLDRSDVDPGRVSVLGASFGAPFAVAAAKAESAISGVVLVHGFGDVPATVQHRLTQSWESRLGFFARPAAWAVSRLGWMYLDAPSPEESARGLSPRQRVLLLAAESDSFIPAGATESLWSALGDSPARRDRLATKGGHLQPGSDGLITEITSMVTEWMRKVELL